MQDLLAPWFAVADRFAPRWRRCLSVEDANGSEVIGAVRLLGASSRGDAHEPAPPLPSPGEQRQLREAFELFALALRVDAQTFVAAATPFGTPTGAHAYEEGRRLAFYLVLDSQTPTDQATATGDAFGYKAFFRKWAEEIDVSEAFQGTRVTLLEMAASPSRASTASPRFDLAVDIRLSGGTDLLATLGVLTAIDRTAFNIPCAKVEIDAPAFNASALERFFGHLARLATGSVVDVSLLLPNIHEDTYALPDWLALLPYALLHASAFHCDLPAGDALVYNVSVVFGNTAEALAIAVLAALLSSSHVASIRLTNAAVNVVRAQWLGHLLRCTSARSVTVVERFLVPGHFAAMKAPLPQHDICRYTGTAAFHGSEPQSSIRDLTVAVSSPISSSACLLQLPVLVAAQLERLTVVGGVKDIPWRGLQDLLASCPRLEALTIRTLHLTAHDAIAFPVGSTQATLRTLCLDVHVEWDVSFVEAVRPLLERYARGLTELRLRQDRLSAFASVAASLGEAIQRFCPCVEMLDLRGPDAASLYAQFALHPSRFRRLHTLAVCSPDSASSVLFTALVDPTHPLARSLRTLHLTDPSTCDLAVVRAFLSMLKTNRELKQASLVAPRLASHALLVHELMVAHEAASRNRRSLAVPSKLAAVSALSRVGLPWSPELLAQVFAFAAPRERRRVLVAFHEAQ